MTDFPLVSIIIVSLNRKTELLNCIESINSQTYKNYEILLIDNNSDDNSSEIIKSKFPNTKVYKTYKNLGTSYTRNAGIKFSEGEIIWFLDSDAYLKDNNVLFNLIKKFNSQKEIDGMGGEAVLNDKDEIIGTKKLTLYQNGMIKGHIDNSNKPSKVKVLATCNLLIKKKAVEEVGGFDHFYFFYLEDLDLTYRIFKKGYKLYLMEECPVIHYFSEKSRFKNYFLANRNRIYFLIKNFNIINIFLLPIFDILYIANLDTLKRIVKKIFNNSNKQHQTITVDKSNFSFKNLFFALKNSFIIIVSMLCSYIYIPYYIILYIINKKKNSNFINLIKTDDFISIKKDINSK